MDLALPALPVLLYVLEGEGDQQGVQHRDLIATGMFMEYFAGNVNSIEVMVKYFNLSTMLEDHALQHVQNHQCVLCM